MTSADAVVVGGGPAGAASALSIRGAGREVTLLESARSFSDSDYRKVCGSFLNAEAVGTLSEMGLLEAVLKAGGHPITSLLVTEPSGHAARVSLASSRGGPLCLRRNVLDGLLLEEAARRGVRVRMGAEVRDVGERRVICREGEIEAETIVLADGKPCRWGSLEARAMKGASGAEGWFGWNADYSDPSGLSSQSELHCFKEGYIGLLSYKPGVTNLCGLSRQRLLKSAGGDFDALIEQASFSSSALKERMRNMTRLTPWKAVGPLPFGRMSPLSGGHFLVGDAAAVIDPFVGGGIGMALQSGNLLGLAVKSASSGDERRRSYHRLWSRCFRRRLFASRYLRSCLEEAWRIRTLVSAMERWPFSLDVLTRFLAARAA